MPSFELYFGASFLFFFQYVSSLFWFLRSIPLNPFVKVDEQEWQLGVLVILDSPFDRRS